jgi:hypothetical protein
MISWSPCHKEKIMSINAIAGYAHAYGLGSYGFGNSIPTQSPSQKSTGPSVGTILQQSQNSAPPASDDGDGSDDAFLTALRQMTQQLNPSLQGVSDSIPTGPFRSIGGTTTAGTTASGSDGPGYQGISGSILTGPITTLGGATNSGTTANGSGGTSTGAAASNATDATSPIPTVTVRPHLHHRFGGSQIDNSDGGQPFQSQSASAGGSSIGSFFNLAAQTSAGQSANPSILSFLSGQSATASTSASSLISQLSSQSGITPSQANSEIGAIMSNFGGSTGAAGSAAATTTTGSTSTTATGSASASSSFTSQIAALAGTPNSASELQNLLQSSSATSATAGAGGGFGAWAQSVEQSLLSTLI